MIQHVTHLYADLDALRAELSAGAVARAAAGARSVLAQVYCANADAAHLDAIRGAIRERLPHAAVVGATTVGEVAHGRLVTSHTVIGFTVFASSQVQLVAIGCGGDADTARAAGAELGRRARQAAADIAGLLLLATPLSIDAAALLQGVGSTLGGCPVFGGGAGDYAAMANSLVFTGDDVLHQGAVAAIFSGPELQLECRTYLGWRPLSRSMRVTQVEGLRVLRIDDEPAFDVYRNYLHIDNDDQFFLNALEFPFLLERDGELLARVPIAAGKDGALQFVADIAEGETVRLGYGDMDLILEDAAEIHGHMARFSPQVVFLYTCGCRRFLMQEDVDLETQPFEALAPTFGFYTYGEFYGTSRLTLLNSTMVAVSLREGPAPVTARPAGDGARAAAGLVAQRDPYANKHARVVSRLLRFINAVTSELEAANREVTKLSVTDRLTQLANRSRLEQVLDEWTDLARRYATPFSVILLDVDHFKRVNDTHGHLVGDKVLMRIAEVLAANTRGVDVVGRWGGEEFLVIAPNLGLREAAQLAEKLRAAVAGAEIAMAGPQTSSFGVAEHQPGDDPHSLIGRADAALYRAKGAGRNRVDFGG